MCRHHSAPTSVHEWTSTKCKNTHILCVCFCILYWFVVYDVCVCVWCVVYVNKESFEWVLFCLIIMYTNIIMYICSIMCLSYSLLWSPYAYVGVPYHWATHCWPCSFSTTPQLPTVDLAASSQLPSMCGLLMIASCELLCGCKLMGPMAIPCANFWSVRITLNSSSRDRTPSMTLVCASGTIQILLPNMYCTAWCLFEIMWLWLCR